MKLPQEIMHWEVIPSIRNQLVKELKELGYNQEKIAEILEITPSAVSQYIKGKRGNHVEFCEDFNADVKNSAKLIYENKSSAFNEIVTLTSTFKDKKMLCPMCKKENNKTQCSMEK